MSQKYAISKAPSCDIMPFRRNTMATPVIRFRIDFAANSWVGPGYRELSDDIAVAAARRLPSIAGVAVQHPKSKAKSPARPLARKY
jgi:hypothetical protein